MKKFLFVLFSLSLFTISFVNAKDKGSIEHVWEDYILTYDWESVVLYDADINEKTQKCPVWYHIWSADEWSKLIKFWYNIKWNNYKYMSLSSKTYNQIEEEYTYWEYDWEDIGFWKIWEDLWFSSSFTVYKTSTKWSQNYPYVFYTKWLDLYSNVVETARTRRYWFIGLKTCNHVYIWQKTSCNSDLLTRCFKNSEKTAVDNWFSKEYNDAYVFAYNNKITTMPSIEEANMNWEIIRAEIAKMLANWVKSFGYYADPNMSCKFTDTSSVKWDLAIAIIEACQYWIMWQWITEFRPYDKITKAEVATAISRILYWTQYDWWTPFYINHTYALENAGVLLDSSNINSNELRWNVMAMLMRANDILN